MSKSVETKERQSHSLARPEVEAALKRCRGTLLALGWRHAFFSVPGARVSIRVDQTLPTAAVEQRGIIYVNAKFIQKLDDEELMFVLGHELLHLLLLHFGRQGQRRNKRWNRSCFPAGTLLPNGVPIETVADRDMITDFDGSLYGVRTQVGSISATEEHPFLVRRRLKRSYPIRLGEPEWLKASEIKVGDFICVPKLTESRLREDSHIDLEPYISEGTDSLGRRTFGNRVINRSLPLTQDLAWLIGLYVAEGSYMAREGKNGFQLSLGSHEDTLISRAQAVIEHLGYGARASKDGSRASVNCSSSVLARWLGEHCGHGAHGKHVPATILHHADPSIRLSFLDGYASGDGYFAKNKPWRTVGTVSRALTHDIPLLLAQDNLGTSVGLLCKGPRWIGESWTNKELNLFQMGWHLNGGATSQRKMNGHVVTTRHARFKIDEHGVWYPVKDVSEVPHQGLVYNMATEDHTYIAGGYLVHNCDRAINFALSSVPVGKRPTHALMPLDPAHNKFCAEEMYEVEPEQLDDSQQLGAKDQPSPGAGCGVVAARGGDGDDGDGASGEGEGPRSGAGKFPSVEEAARMWREAAAYASANASLAGDSSLDVLANLLIVPPSRVKWRDVLKGVASRALNEHGRDDVSFLRRNRRSATSDFILPGGITNRAQIAVAVDTSGSMADDDIAQAVAEIKAIVDMTGVKAFLAVHDADLQWAGWILPRAKVDDIGRLMTGRGGTRFAPAYDAIAAASKRFDGMVHLTDGEPFDAWPDKPNNVRRLIVALLGCQSQHAIPDFATVVEVEL